MCALNMKTKKFDLDEIKKDTSRIKDSSSNEKAPNPEIKILRILVYESKEKFYRFILII